MQALGNLDCHLLFQPAPGIMKILDFIFKLETFCTVWLVVTNEKSVT